ncbi:unnamed protein product [Arabidopsis halleri]
MVAEAEFFFPVVLEVELFDRVTSAVKSPVGLKRRLEGLIDTWKMNTLA